MKKILVLIKSKFSASTSDSEQCAAAEVPNPSLLYYILQLQFTGPLPSALKKDFKNSEKTGPRPIQHYIVFVHCARVWKIIFEARNILLYSEAA